MAKHNTIVPKKRGRPVGSKNTMKYNHNIGPSTIKSSSRALLQSVQHDLTQRTGINVTLRATIQYLVGAYMTGEFK